MNGKGAESGAPTLTINKGRRVTFTSTETDKDFTVTVKKDNVEIETVTVTNGTGSTALIPGEYTYDVAKANGYQASTGNTLTVSDSSVTKELTLTENVPTTVTITAPETITVPTSTGGSLTYTAAVTDQDGDAITAPLTWSIVDTPANISVADGVVTVNEGAAAGTYTVKAEVTSDSTKYDTKTFEVVAKTPTKITINYVDADKESTDEGYLLKTEEITSDVFVGESYTIADSYVADFDTSDKGIPYKKYSYQESGSDSLTIAEPVASNNDVTIKCKSDGVSYYYENDCSSATGWKVGAAGTFTVEDGYASITSTGSGNRTAYTKFDDTTQSVNSGVMKVSFDFMRTNNVVNKTNCATEIALFKSGYTPTDNSKAADPIWFIYSGSGAGATSNRVDTFAINEELVDKTETPNLTTAAHPFTFTASKWFNVTIYVNLTNHKQTYIITNKTDSTDVTSEYDIAIDEAITGVGGIHIQAARAGGAYCVDNIEVSSGTMPVNPNS